MKTFIAGRAKDGPVLEKLFNKYTEKTLDMIKKECKMKMPIASISVLTTCCTLITSLTKDLTDAPNEAALERFFIYALMWSIAGVLENEDRAKVDKFLRNMTSNMPEATPPDTVFEFNIDTSTSSYEWSHWGSKIPPWTYGGSNLAAEFASLPVSAEIKELFQYITRYKPHNIELETKMRPFIPDYIPAVGDIDPFVKVPRPDGKADNLGLDKLDEPAALQSDPNVLQLQLRAVSKSSGAHVMAVASVDAAEKDPKAISRWIASINDLHRHKPPPSVHYSKPMPDIEALMHHAQPFAHWPTSAHHHVSVQLFQAGARGTSAPDSPELLPEPALLPDSPEL